MQNTKDNSKKTKEKQKKQFEDGQVMQERRLAPKSKRKPKRINPYNWDTLDEDNWYA